MNSKWSDAIRVWIFARETFNLMGGYEVPTQSSWTNTCDSVPIASSVNWNSYYYLQCNQPLLMDGYYFPPRQPKQTSFRNEWANTQKVESILQATPNVTCSLLMNSSKSMQQVPSTFCLHLSAYLCYPNLHLRSRTSYMVLPYLANLTTRRCISICYPGSIENIKLLGALYWLTDWLQYSTFTVHCSTHCFFPGSSEIKQHSYLKRQCNYTIDTITLPPVKEHSLPNMMDKHDAV
jgi:hypothetical protein